MKTHLLILLMLTTLGCSSGTKKDSRSQTWPPPLPAQRVVGMWLAPNGGDELRHLLWLRADRRYVIGSVHCDEHGRVIGLEYVVSGHPWRLHQAKSMGHGLMNQTQISLEQRSIPVAYVSDEELKSGLFMNSVLHEISYRRADAGTYSQIIEHLHDMQVTTK
ncbi:MAG: hypothetical protein AAGH88_12280 [Planctomycetota bacterium]